MNNVTLIGRTTREPELRHLPNGGNSVATFTLAVDRNLSKEKKQEAKRKGGTTADFIPVTVWGKQAESCAEYLAKGRMVAVSGRITTGNYEKDGKTVYTTEVTAERVQFLEFGEKNTTATNGYADQSGMQFATANASDPFPF